MPTAKYKHAGAGTQTAGLSFGGIPAPGGSAQSTSEEYDGSSWSSGGTLGTAAERCAGSGTQTLALCFGGPPDTDLTQIYNGTSWSTAPLLSTGRGYLMGVGTGSAALAFGGHPPTVTTTEEFTGETETVTGKTLTTG